MKLRDLLTGADLRKPIGNADAEITSLAYNSLRVTPSALFVAIRGAKTDGNRFVFDAIERGARAVVSELPRPWAPQWAALYASETVTPREVPPSVEWIEVPDARKALAGAAANFFGRPAEALKLVGVTGTNGKTTITYLIDSVVRAAGHAAGLFGTIAHRTPRSSRVATNTTPESLDLQSFLAEVRDAGGTYAVLEASSHALAMDRVWGCPFAVAVFTNLTRDHLDFHKTFEDYFAAKRRLFEGTGRGVPAVGVVNTDDSYGRRVAGLAARTLAYGLEDGAEVTTKKFSLSFSGLEFTAHTPSGKLEVRSRLVGRINVYNILAAIGAAIGLGIAREAIEAGIRNLESVPGRFERIEQGQPYLLVVDYAHTDDALRNLIATARELNPAGRILTLFGCGGDRDRAKRPLMGEVAGRMSDLVVLTSDNPRSEDPLRIINDAVVGLQKAEAKYVVEPDRAVAVERALDQARPGDIVLLAGKGHETYQVLRNRTIEFDDREVARRSLRLRGYGG
ncbi:MAG: UDP-N-acetylmuramoyl-L-alanyl-D-glutamate--2,6-diaminopimelate ligase [Acidobacteria bacterium]|nr:UDP-N-acetylmuramoyl-L-alanyl-D-glutamate--2,6-diaminopimelate ligase [Acidobacteriota bacterium]